MIAQYGFNLHFPNGKDVEHLFMCLPDHCVSSLVDYLFISFAQFLIGFFNVEFYRFFIYLKNKTFIGNVI